MQEPAHYSVLNNHSCHQIETHSGRYVDLLHPRPVDIDIDDIAWALSRIARYNGHTHGERIYTVAEHSILCLEFAQQFFNIDDRMALHVLLHDAHEAYMGDIVTPLKQLFGVYSAIRGIEAGLQSCIEDALDIGHTTSADRDFIKMIDEYALAIEAYHLMCSGGKVWKLRDIGKEALQLLDEPMTSAAAARHFVHKYHRLKARTMEAAA